jgi:hypothetical protein
MGPYAKVGLDKLLIGLARVAPSTGTIRPTVCVRTTISNLEGVQMVCLVARTVSGGNRMSPEPNRWDKALRPWYRSFGK